MLVNLKQPEKNLKIFQFDGLRGIAAIWVVLFHYLFFLNASKGLTLGYFQSIVEKGYLGVDIFFILSGFIIAYNYASCFSQHSFSTAYLGFIKNRLARIYPSYILSLCILLGFYFFGNLKNYAASFSVFDLKSFIFNFLMIQTWFFQNCRWSWNLPGWTVSVEWFLYLLFPFILNTCFKTKTIFRCFLIISASFLLMFWLIFFNAQFFIMQGMQFGLIRGVLEFIVGISLFFLTTQLQKKIFFSKLPYNFFVAVYLIFIFIGSYYNINNCMLICAISFLIFFLYLSDGFVKKLFSSALMRGLGKLSYTIYILQFPYQIVSNHLFSGLDRDMNYFCRLMLYFSQVLCLVIIAWIVYYFYENPLRKIIRNSSFKLRHKELVSVSVADRNCTTNEH